MKNIMYELHQQLTDALECEKANIIMTDYPEDRIAEMVNSYIPIYYGQLAADTSLAEPDDLSLIEGVTDVWKIIPASVYERLSATAYKWLSNIHDEDLLEAA